MVFILVLSGFFYLSDLILILLIAILLLQIIYEINFFKFYPLIFSSVRCGIYSFNKLEKIN